MSDRCVILEWEGRWSPGATSGHRVLLRVIGPFYSTGEAEAELERIRARRGSSTSFTIEPCEAP